MLCFTLGLDRITPLTVGSILASWDPLEAWEDSRVLVTDAGGLLSLNEEFLGHSNMNFCLLVKLRGNPSGVLAAQICYYCLLHVLQHWLR